VAGAARGSPPGAWAGGGGQAGLRRAAQEGGGGDRRPGRIRRSIEAGDGKLVVLASFSERKRETGSRMRSERRRKLRAIADRGLRGCSRLILFTMSRELQPAACGPAQGLVLLKTGAFSNKRPNLPAKVYGPDDLYLISNDYECYRRVVVSARWVTTQLIAVTNMVYFFYSFT
jgi:hypothetical protein